MICPHCKNEIEPVEETASNISIVKDEKGRSKIWTEGTRDSDNILLSKRTDEYLYYENGDINTILQKVHDGEGTLLSKKEVKHFEDGRQPVVELNIDDRRLTIN